MAPKPTSIGKKAIEQYDADHIMTREKKVITDELIREHKRAEHLAKAIENITKIFAELDGIAKKPGAEIETDSVAKLRLSKDVTDIMAKVHGLKISELKGLLDPKKVTILASDDDLTETNVNEEQNNPKDDKEIKSNEKTETKTYKFDPNTKVLSGKKNKE